MTTSEARKAIREFDVFVSNHKLEGAASSLAMDVLGILTEAARANGSRDFLADFKYNVALHKAELKLDKRINKIAELRKKMGSAVEAALFLVIRHGLGVSV